MNKVKYHLPKWFLCLITLLFITITVSANTYYLNAVSGNDLSSGAASQPWKTLSKTYSIVKSGDTVILSNGNYGAFTKSIGTTNNTNWITYMAAPGQLSVKFDKIYILGNQADAYFNFVGIDVEFPALPSCVLTSVPVAFFKGVNYIKLSKCKIHAINTYDSDGGINFYANLNNTTAVHDLLVDSCDIYNTQTGIRFGGLNTIITNNHIHHIHGTFIGNPCGKMSPTNLNSSQNVLIENNHLHDMHFFTNEPCYDSSFSQAHASIIGIRGRDWVVRNNHMHDAWSPGIQLYGDDCGGAYDRANLLFENNIYYDNQGLSAFYNPGTSSGNHIGGKIIFRHNTFISGRQDSSWTTTNNPVNRFKANGQVQSLSLILSSPTLNPYDGTGTLFEDNIFMTETGLGNFNYQSFNDSTAKWIAKNNLIYTKLWNCGTLDSTNYIVTSKIANNQIPADYIDNQIFTSPNYAKQHGQTHTNGGAFDLTPKNGSIICKMSTTGSYIGALPCKPITSVSEKNATYFSMLVYPNPANKILTITLANKPKVKEQVQIYNALGLLIKVLEIEETLQLDIEYLPKGLYFIRLINYPNQTQKILKI